MPLDPQQPDGAAVLDDDRRSSGWDIRNAAGNYTALIVYQAGSAIFSFAAVWLITRYLGSEGYGGIVAVIAASQVAQVAVNWTGIAVVRYGVDEFIETSAIARTFWTRFGILAINLVLLLAAVSVWFPPLADWLKLSQGALWLVAAHLALSAIWLHVQMSLQAAKMLRAQGMLQMGERLVIFAAIGIFAAFGGLTVTNALAAYIAAPLVAAVAGVVMLRGLIFQRFAFDAELVRRILTFSLPLLPFTLVAYFSGSYVDAVFISNFLSTRDLGIYSVATQINGIAMQIPTLANSILLGLFITLRSEDGGSRLDGYFRHAIPTLTLVWGAACSVLAFAAYYLISAIFGSEFNEASQPVWILLSAAVVALPTAIGYSARANSESKTYIAMAAGITSAAANIAANFILIPRYGMVGCAWATILAYFASVLVFGILLRTRAATPISWTFLAMAPSVAGAAIITVWGNAVLAIVCVLALSCLLGIIHFRSIKELAALSGRFAIFSK